MNKNKLSNKLNNGRSKSSVVLTMNCDHRVIDGAVGIN